MLQSELTSPPCKKCFSRTLFVTLADARDVVVHLRTEPLDIDAFRIARASLGSCIPEIKALSNEELESAQAWVNSLTLMLGKIWPETKEYRLLPPCKTPYLL